MRPGPVALLFGLLLLTAASGCGPRSPQPPPEALTLYALNPLREHYGASPKEGFLYGYRILGSTEISEPDRRAELMSALQRSIDESPGDRMRCFNPRHGLRVTDNGVVREYVICFQCFVIVVYREGARESVEISDYAAPIFNRFLTEEGLPIPE